MRGGRLLRRGLRVLLASVLASAPGLGPELAYADPARAGAAATSAARAEAPAPRAGATLVPFDAPESARLFADAEKALFWPLVRTYQSERIDTYCAVASGVMVLNALHVSSPPQPLVFPYHEFDQDNFFSEEALRIAAAPAVAAAGMTLDQLAAVLRVHGLAVEVHHAGETTVDRFRALAREAVARGDRYVVVNYWRAALGQVGPGHFSPIAAYHEKSDRFLVLDVARYKYAPWWAEAPALWGAMHSEDPASGEMRGFLLVSRR